MKNTGLLKVMSILKIIGAALSIILALIMLFGAAIVAGVDMLFGTVQTLYYFSVVLMIVAIVIDMICGISGLKACSVPAKADFCIKIGIVSLVISVISDVISFVYYANAGQGTVGSILATIVSLVLSVLYIVGALNVKKAN